MALTCRAMRAYIECLVRPPGGPRRGPAISFPASSIDATRRYQSQIAVLEPVSRTEASLNRTILYLMSTLPTANAPKSFDELVKLVEKDNKVKVAGA